MPDFASIVKRHNLIVAAEAAMVHALWYDEYGELYHEKTAALIERGREITTDELLEALEGRRQLTNQLSMLMDEHDLDLWISPSAPGAAPTGLDSTGDPVMNLPWTHSGLPSVNIPSGQDGQGLPLGLQVAGRWYEDEALLAWSIQLEPVLQSE
jgi:Asp-tRNA(Asn)/Glu-tRNA(Gln) amidotransferase A subunit family amidase